MTNDPLAELANMAAGVVTAADLLSQELPEPRWAVKDLLPEGLAILAGRPKMGKSWNALGLSLAVACGGYALGSIKVDAGEVLYLALEDTKRRLQARIRQLTRGAPPGTLHLAVKWPRLDQGGLTAIETWAMHHPHARMVVLDTFTKARAPKSARGDPYAEDYAAAAQLKDIADRFGLVVLVIMHTRKPMGGGDQDALDSVLGTSGLTGAADTVIILKRDRGKADAVLFVTGRDIEERELALKFDPLIGWVLLGDADEYRLSEERAAIISLLREVGRFMTPAEAAPLLNKKPGTVKYLLWRMHQDGQLGSDGRGGYCVADKSVDRANSTNRANRVDRANQAPLSLLSGQPGQPPVNGHVAHSEMPVNPVSAVNPYAQVLA